MRPEEFVAVLRGAAPYVHAHHGSTFVVAFPGETCSSPHFAGLLGDLALISSLGVRLVLVHGARPQIDAQLALLGIEPRYHHDRRITDSATMSGVKAAVGALRLDIESGLAAALASAAIGGGQVPVTGGTWVTARPEGILDGVDLALTGRVRRVDIAAIREAISTDRVVLLSPVGYSPTGEIFNLRSAEVAEAVAVGLEADKLVFVLESDPRSWPTAGDASHFLIGEAERALGGPDLLAQLPAEDRSCVQAALRAARHGVTRVHLVGGQDNGGLLRELYTRDGGGLMVYAAEDYEALRPARAEDIPGIQALLAPLEAEGVLVPRSQERLERDIDQFTVMVRDGMVIATNAVHDYPEDGLAELAAVAVHPQYRGGQRAATLLLRAERDARKRGIGRLFVLTTQTPHWFLEHGFTQASVDDLPVARRQTYNTARRSVVMIKTLKKVKRRRP
ncbi:MAG: amino-acid N-acetyltransferase [Actinomycetia bacterium]|nr:amino-acid N-acetyltransferase [Actinomycetes bacterium]